MVDRNTLIAAGWAQGAIIDREHVAPDHPAEYFVILSQTCDILNGSLSAEPTVELLPIVLKPGKNKPDKNLANGFNPRKIDFQVTIKRQPKWHSAEIPALILLPREKLLICRPSVDALLPPETLNGLLNWRIARYTRTAFPEAFEKAWKKQKENLLNAITARDDLIDSMLISLDPFDEINEGDYYEVEIILLIRPQIFADPTHSKSLKQVSEEIQTHLSAIPEFAEPHCAVQSLASMNLWDRRKFVDFSRYDYLSFGEAD
jgi:hypothetical protein